MFTYYNLRRKKLSFSYVIQFNFTRDNDYYTGDSEYNLLKKTRLCARQILKWWR